MESQVAEKYGGGMLVKGNLLIKLLVKKEVLIALLIGVFTILAAVCYVLGTDYLKQLKGQEALTAQISEVGQTLAQIPESPQGLEQRLAEAQTSLVAEQNAFPAKMSSTDVVNSILELADKCEVEAVPLITAPWSTEKVAEHDYYVFQLNIVAEGTLAQLMSFVSQLENGEFKTLIVEEMSITRVGEPTEEGAAEESIPVTANLDLAIYARPLNLD